MRRGSAAHWREARLARNKTAPDDATVLLALAERMPFSAWNPPSTTGLTLQTISARALGYGARRTSSTPGRATVR